MPKSYARAKGRKVGGEFLAIPKAVLNHENFLNLSPQANKLLLDLGRQFKGFNNGDLCATWSLMREQGWKSKETLNDALLELQHYGLIVCTQLGGLNKPSLYALGWNEINKANSCSGIKVGDRPDSWKKQHEKFTKPSKIRRRKKEQERLAGQSGTKYGAVTKILTKTEPELVRYSGQSPWFSAPLRYGFRTPLYLPCVNTQLGALEA